MRGISMKILGRMAVLGLLGLAAACGSGTTEVSQELTPQEQQAQEQYFQRVQQMEQQMSTGAAPGQAPAPGSLPPPAAPAPANP